MLQQRSPTVRKAIFDEQDKVRMDFLRKISSDRVAAGYRKWGLLCSFLITAGLLVVFLCYVESSHSGAGDTFREIKLGEEDKAIASSSEKLAFTDTVDAYSKWDEAVGCSRFREKYRSVATNRSCPASLQNPESISCDQLKQRFVSIFVKSWTWIPDNLDNLYSCSCGLSCMWTKSPALADNPDALFFEWNKPPMERQRGDPLRIYIELEAERQPAPSQDIFVSYHRSSDVQATYAGALFHNTRSYHISLEKNKDVLVYWSSSRCLPARQAIATKFLSLVSHHSFGKCLNNVGGRDTALQMYPECRQKPSSELNWSDHLHCTMSHYKFVLAIENTRTESYVTEKLFYALDAGAVPIYFGAPNVADFVPPHSIIDGSKFESMQKLAQYVVELAEDPVRYAEYHAWRRCGVAGNYYWTRATSLDSLPCRLCAHISRLGGRDA